MTLVPAPRSAIGRWTRPLAPSVIALALITGCASMPRAQRTAITGVRAARARYATAWNAADTLGLSRLWMSGFQLTQEEGIHWSSAELLQQVRGLRLRDSGHRREWYPRDIRLLLPAKLAVERGRFTVEYTGRPPGAETGWIRGVYTAQWYLSPAGWLLNAEIETPLECTGAALRMCTVP